MPRRGLGPTSVQADRLRRLRVQGGDSPVLDARVAWTEAEGLQKSARMLCRKDGIPLERVYPSILPTAQASGRPSTTNPPLVTFPARDDYSVAWGMILPDLRTYWIHFDLSALHARIACAYTNDPDDLQAFQLGWDVHTLTACRMYGWRFEPPDRVLDCPDWKGKPDRRRRLAKVFRYALLLGKNEMAALESKDVEREGLDRDEVFRIARLYLRSKPTFVEARKRIWAECARTHMARTFMGRLRRLYGEPDDQAKEGWSHILQGGEEDIAWTIVRDLFQGTPEATLVLHSYDGLTWSMPERGEEARQLHLQSARGLVERTWNINGKDIPIPADWEVLFPDGGTIRGEKVFST